jgi:hypothetical protein
MKDRGLRGLWKNHSIVVAVEVACPLSPKFRPRASANPTLNILKS